MKITNKFWFGVGVFFFAMGCLLTIKRIAFLQDSEVVSGEVKGYVVTQNEGEDVYWPVIYFLTKDVYAYEFKSSVATHTLEVGDKVLVRYKKSNPNEAWAEGDLFVMWLGVFILFLISIGTLNTGVDFKKRKSKVKKRKK